MLAPRILFFLTIGSELVADAGFVYNAEQTHIPWYYLPTNWLNSVVFVYFLLLLVASYLSAMEMEAKFEPGPISPLYLVIWNLFHATLPLVGTAWVANDTVVKSDDKAYSATLVTAFVCMTLDAWFGAYMAHPKLVTTPQVILGLFLLYTAAMDLAGGVVLYQALSWRAHPAPALWYAFKLLVIQLFFSLLWLLLLSTKNDVWGIFHYKQAPKKAFRLQA